MGKETKNTLDKLIDLTNRLNQPKGEWDWDIINNVLLWSKEVFTLFDLTPKTFKGTYNAFLETVHPDDREYVETAITSALGGTLYSINHRIILSDGSERVVHEEGSVFFNAKGEPIRMKGIVQDISKYGQNSEEEWRLFVLDIVIKNSNAIAGLQVRAGMLSAAVAAVVSIASTILIMYLTGVFNE